MNLPPKPASRPEKVTLFRYLRLFRKDILSAQPAKLYRARMAVFKTPFFRSYLVNEPELIREVLNRRPLEFPKSDRIGAGLRPLLGNSVFVTNGPEWERQRRIIDPAFEGGRIKEAFPSILDAAEAAVCRLTQTDDRVEIEEQASFAAADVIFRTLFSIPIEDKVASSVFNEFRAYQRTQPILNLSAFLPKIFPKAFLSRKPRAAAESIRALIHGLTLERQAVIDAGTAPDDLATKIMTLPDPQSGMCFSTEEMVDQVAIFFLAGHETSASALAWALYLLATHPEWQENVASEAIEFTGEFSDLSKLKATRNVFREALRLYPPVPMMVRETTQDETFRDRQAKAGEVVIISPWHLHRHERLWDNPDAFEPDRWETDAGRLSSRDAYLPFSSGSRVCPGAGFAMMEGVLLLSKLVGAFKFEAIEGHVPVPVAHLTVRARDGIWLKKTARKIS
jgi:cytochrome P450